MKLKLFICTMVIMSARSALAIKTPSATEIDDIQKQIYAANRMDKQIGAAEQLVRDAESVNRSAEHISRLKKNVAREKEKKNAARTKAIHMTILAYGLEPRNWSGKSVMSATKGRAITWMPVARESGARQIQSKGGELRDVKPMGDYAGITYIDGVTYMDPSAFEKGPGYLASYLLHERIHFEQFTTDGKGNKMSYAQAQQAAYQAQVDNAEHFFDRTVPAELRMMQDIEIERDTEKAKVDLEKKEGATILGRLRGLFPRSSPPDMFEAKVHANAELADISGLVAQARAQADMARREREERSRAAAEKTAKREHDERLKRTMGDLALRSCANPGSVTQAELDGLPRPYDEDFYRGKLPNGLEGTDGTGYCTEPYIYMGKGAKNGLDAEKLRNFSSPSAPANALVPPPPQAIRAIPATPPIRVVPSIPFSSVLPGLKNLAVTACRSSGQIPVEKRLTEPYYRYSFSQERDDRAADHLAAGLGSCDGRLFRRMIELIRAGLGANISSQWVQDRATEYSRTRDTPSFDYSPPTGCIPGDNSRRNCIACGNSHCG